MNPDAELLQLYARTRDAAAFTSLVQRHMPMVYRAAWRQLAGDAHGAEDVAQAVFTLLACKAGGLGHGNLAGWLHVATRNVVRDHLRAGRRRAIREQEAARMMEHSLEGGADVAADWDRLRPWLDEALGDLRPDDREALLLRYFQGLNLAAVGAALEVGEDAARMRVNRALERLRDQLARRGIKSTAAALGVVLVAEPALAASSAGLATTVAAAALAEAAAAGGVASLAGFWLFMNSVKLMVAGAAALAAVGWATWEYGQQELVLQEAIRAEATAAKITAARKLPPPVPAAATEPAVKSAAAPAAAGSVPRKTAKEREAEAQARGEAFMAAHPEVRAALIESRRASAAADFASFYIEHQLAPAQRQAFEEIFVQSRSAGMTIGGFDRTGDLTFRLPKLLDEKEQQARLEALLGAEGMAAFQTWQKSRDGAYQVREVAGWAAESGQPMTTDQAQALRNIFVNTKPPGRDRDATAYWDEIIARATALLPPAQVEALALQKARAELSQADSASAKAELAAKQGSG